MTNNFNEIMNICSKEVIELWMRNNEIGTIEDFTSLLAYHEIDSLTKSEIKRFYNASGVLFNAQYSLIDIAYHIYY